MNKAYSPAFVKVARHSGYEMEKSCWSRKSSQYNDLIDLQEDFHFHRRIWFGARACVDSSSAASQQFCFKFTLACYVNAQNASAFVDIPTLL